ncbi:CPXCG motif-containing cysteine-rich protein [Flavobacteriaceae bacterium XHP0103]|uniref:CPXCG motif-containing cysteine-rich protein n=1 Tax=Marixanthotalea marina TaxID=2844359 RepID=UPI002989BC2E|nr:CPXCG motif-containing cysteine-rich protein [Marixanthotalea marina]MBU3821251.1 CPXCG motif-containing cysteine-rich protein [Marixanthotalea marina]
MVVHYFTCPHCWETISMVLDNSISEQVYIEDCEICCNPIEVSVKFSGSELVDFQASSIEQ